MISSKKVAITGGCGFIGSHIAEAMAEFNEVIVIDNLSSGKLENIKGLDVDFIQMDVQDEELVKILDNVNYVFHHAANVFVDSSLEDPLFDAKVNILGLINLLECCRKKKVPKIVFSSSSALYSNNAKVPTTEKDTSEPGSPYGVSKKTGEQYMFLYNRLYNMQNICLRYFNVYGPRQDPSGGYACLIPKSINLVLNGRSPEINGNGEQTRDFTYVRDVIEANVLAATTNNEKAFGQIFNVGNGNNFSVNDVVKSIIGIKDIKPEYKPPVIEPKDTLADTTKIKEILKWQPKFNFEEGIKETIDWFEKN